MSYLFMFMAGMLFCLVLVLSLVGHAGTAIHCLFGVGGSLFMAWVWAKHPPYSADSATERKS